MAGKPTALVAGLGLGAALILWSDKPPHPAASPKPVTHTVIVHTVTQAASGSHSPVSGTDIVLMVIASLVVVLVLALNRRA